MKLKLILHSCCIFCLCLLSCKNISTPTIIEKNGRYGLVGKDTIIPPLYNYIYYGYEKNLIKVDSGIYQGLYDTKGKILAAAQYTYIEPFENDRAIVGNQGDGNFKYSRGLIDKNGKSIMQVQYRNIARTGNFYVLYDKNQRCALYDSNGKALTQFRFRSIYPINDTLICIVNSQTLYGIIHIKGHIIVPCAYHGMEFSSFDMGLIKVKKNGRYGYIDLKNNTKIKLQYKEIDSFKEGVAWAKDSSGNIGYIDDKGLTVIPFVYSEPNTNLNNRHFNHGLAPVFNGKKYGLINKNNQVISDYKYDQISEHRLGFYYEIGNGYDKSSLEYNTLEFGFIDSIGSEIKYKNTNTTIPQIQALSNEDILTSFIGQSYLTDFNTLINHHLEGLVNFAPSYKDRNNYPEILVSFGLLLTDNEAIYLRENFGFKYHILKQLISNDTFIDLFWKRYRNDYQTAFSGLDAYTKQLYKKAISDLHHYIHHYDLKSMTQYFIDQPENFARLNPDGSYSEFRKLRAFLDRLIIKHKALSPKSAVKWIDTIYNDMIAWE